MKKIILTALFASLSIAIPAMADTVLLTNNFIDGTTAGWTDNGTTTTLTVQDDTGGIGTGNAMKYATTLKNNAWSELSLGQTVTLDVNDSISLSMDVRFTGDYNSPPTINNSIRWMFMTTADVMTGVGINPGAVQAQGSWFQVGATLQSSKFASVNLGTASHHVLLTLTRKDDGAGSYMQFSYTLDGTTTFEKNGAVIAAPTTEFSFDAIQLGSSALEAGDIDGVDGILYDNIIVSTTGAPVQTPTLVLAAGSQSFTRDQGETAALPLLIQNTGFDATNITVSLSTTSAWFSVLTPPIATAFLSGSGGAMTNTFSVSVDGNAPAGNYPGILSLEMIAYNLEGSAVTSTAPVSLTILSTNIPKLVINASAQTFTDGTVAGWTPDTIGGISAAVTNDDAGIGTGNALLITSVSSNRRVTTPLSESVTLSETNSITMSFDYRYLNPPTNVNAALEFRFTDSTSSNYAGLALNPASSAIQTLVFGRDGDTNEGKVNSFDHGTNTQSMILKVTRVTDTNANTYMQFDASWAGNPTGPYTAGSTSIVTDPTHSFTFDTLSIGITGGTITDGLLLDNIAVTTTEPIAPPPPPDPVLGTIAFSMPGNSSYMLTWTSENGVSYQVKTTTNLVSGIWIPVITNIAGNGGALSVTGTVTEATGFYQVFVE